jgi:hypothetical protein
MPERNIDLPPVRKYASYRTLKLIHHELQHLLADTGVGEWATSPILSKGVGLEGTREVYI